MSGFREKAQVFLLGLMLGLLIGGGFFILKLDNYFKELSLYKTLTKDEESPKEEAESKEVKANDEKPLKKKDEAQTPLNDQEPKSDSTLAESSQPGNPSDSLFPDTLIMAEKMSQDDEIVVRKDEMLSSRAIEVVNLSANADKAGKDSLLQKVSGVREDSKGTYKVEYWKSPINYKGYKMSRNKLVLYGISSADAVSLFKIDDDIYMKHLSTVYRLAFTNDFRQFEKVSDPVVLARLNK